jgi:O-antigen ligase
LADSTVVTLLAVPLRSRPHADAKMPLARSPAAVLEHVAMVAMLCFWGLPFTHAIGGRGVHAELLFALVLVPLLLLMQVWQAPAGSLLMAAVTGAAALAVCLWAPTGWWGSDGAASYVLSAAAFVAARRYVRDDHRRALVAAAICLAGVAQFFQSFLTWWSGRNPAVAMSGTFYWHNPYAAFLLPGAVIGLGLVAERRSPWHLIGWLSVPTCTAGIVLSSSRATMAVLVVADLIIAIASLRSRTAASRTLVALLLAVGITAALPGPPFFSHYSSPFAATDARVAAGETLAQNGAYRTEFWREAAAVALHRPLVGGGYHSLATASALYTPSSWARSQLAHDGYLQVATDGGLLLALPFLAGVIVLLLWALRRLWVLIARRSRPAPDLLVVALTVAVLGAFAHSAVDFDWSHPSILVEAALLTACLAPAHRRSARSRRTGSIKVAATVVLVGSLGVCVAALHQWQIDQPVSSHSPTALLAEAHAPFGDYRPAAFLLGEVLSGERTASRAQLEQALALTSREASVDIHQSLVRDAVGAQIGVDPQAVTQAEDLLARVDGSTASYVPDLANVLLGAHQLTRARTLLSRDIAGQARARSASPQLGEELDVWARRIGRGAQYACEIKTVTGLGVESTLASLPTAVATCPVRPHQGSV